MKDKRIYFKVTLQDDPENGFITDRKGVTDLLDAMGCNFIEHGDEQGYSIYPVLMTIDEYENLPEFTGF